MMRRILVVLALLLSASAPLASQASPPRTVYAAPNPLFVVVPDQPLYCAAVQLDPQFARQGIATMYQFQLPLTGRIGQLGVRANGVPRYLLVYTDRQGVPHIERLTATVHFALGGEAEVARQSWELIRSDGGEPQRNVHGLGAAESAAAWKLATHLAARCR